MSLTHQMRALGKEDLPAEIFLDGKAFRHCETFKHTSIAAVGLYEREGERVVLKCYRKARVFGVPTAWVGRLMAAHEVTVMRQVEGVRGVPRLRGRYDATSIVRDYVPGRPLTRHTRVGEEFFPDLFRVLGELHARGVAYVDLEKAANILLGDDARPHLIDFQVAFFVPDRFLGRTLVVRIVRKWLERADLYHARKHFRRLMRERLTEQEMASSRRKPWPVRIANAVHAPFKKLRRWFVGKG